jgi:hypothetical protein
MLIKTTCPSCGKETPTSNRVCEWCGANLSGGPAPASRPPSALPKGKTPGNTYIWGAFALAIGGPILLVWLWLVGLMPTLGVGILAVVSWGVAGDMLRRSRRFKFCAKCGGKVVMDDVQEIRSQFDNEVQGYEYRLRCIRCGAIKPIVDA